MIETQDKFEEALKEKYYVSVFSCAGPPKHVDLSVPDVISQRVNIFSSLSHTAIVSPVGNFIFKMTLHGFKDGSDINLSYWEEKCVSTDYIEGVKVFSKDAFERRVRTWRELGVVDAHQRDCILDHGPSTLTEAMTAIKSDFNTEDFPEDLFTEEDFMVYSYRYIWCCRALRFAAREFYK